MQTDPVTMSDILTTLTLRGGYNTNAVLLGTTLLGLAAGVVGAFGLLRKRSLTADALAHATLPGIAGMFLIVTALGGDGRSMPLLMLGAGATGIVGVAAIHALLRATRLKEDAAIGIVLSVFFGVGVVLLSYVQQSRSGSGAGLNHYIYGQTAAMTHRDAVLMGVIGVAASVTALVLIKEFALVCFNEGFARAIGLPVWLIDGVMLALIVVITVTGLQAVGLILVVALLIIPPAAARFWTDRLWRLVLISAFIGALSGYSGAAISALLPNKPAGAVIVLVAGGLFAISMLLAPRRGAIADLVRRVRLRMIIARDHVLETLYERELGVGRQGPIASTWPMTTLLRARGWVSGKGAGLSLTDSGRAQGARVHRNHRLWEQYLISYADIAPTHVDWSVDQVEHVLSDELIEQLEATLRGRGVRIAPAMGGGDAR